MNNVNNVKKRTKAASSGVSSSHQAFSKLRLPTPKGSRSRYHAEVHVGTGTVPHRRYHAEVHVGTGTVPHRRYHAEVWPTP